MKIAQENIATDTDYANTMALRDCHGVTGPTKQVTAGDWTVCAGLNKNNELVGFRYPSDGGPHSCIESIKDRKDIPEPLLKAFNF